jgi:hypothetical protein
MLSCSKLNDNIGVLWILFLENKTKNLLRNRVFSTGFQKLKAIQK